jgi:glucose/arabinose dehydrogenase
MPPSHPRVLLARALACVALLASLSACGDSSTEPHTGSLVIPAITGLPPGVTTQVVVTGPGGFSRAFDGAVPDTLDALAPGAYHVRAAELLLGGTRWSPTPDSQTVGVYDGFRFSARAITYAVTTARLAVEVLGLPVGAPAAIAITGPAGFTRTVTASDTLGPLEPGSYTVTASDVQAGGRTFRPGPATQSVTLAKGETGAVLVDHGTGTATLVVDIQGLLPETDAQVTVTGPGGFTRALQRSRTLMHLEPGSYTVTAARFPGSLVMYSAATETQVRELAANGSATVGVAYIGTTIDLRARLVVEGLVNPSFLTAPAGDARLFVVERAGRVRIVKDGTLLPTPFLDIRARVNSVGERGLLGMAFDPEYSQSGRFYVFYVDLSGNVVVERFASSPGSDVAGAPAGIVISIPHGGSEHHGGMIAFGPDGMLYLGPGDGGCCGDPRENAQNLNVLLGKVLRLDVRSSATYTIPAGNPYVGREFARPEIWALGLRNPWRFSFDAPTKRLYIGDVGQDAVEEVNVAPSTAAGRNYGWPLWEGISCYRTGPTECEPAGLTPPVLHYSHSEGCSVTGGYVYRGSQLPELTGHYFYADYCRGWVRSFRLQGDGAASEWHDWLDITVPLALSFGVDGAGELYVVSGAGRIWKLVRL